MKDLEYFKFKSRDWLTGNITAFPLAAQGLFINICAELWDRDGILQNNPKVLSAKFRIPEKEFSQYMEQFQHPEFDILRLDECGFIKVKFIEKQMRAAEKLSEANSKAAIIRWENERRKKKGGCGRNAGA